MNMQSKSVLRFPIKILLLWNFLTIFLFIFSPYQWPITTKNYILLLTLLFISLFFLYAGYLVGLGNSLKFHYNPPSNILRKWFNISLYLKILWILPSYCDSLGLGLFEFKVMFLRLALGFTNFGESYAYRAMIEFENSSFSSFFMIKQILYAITALTIPLGIILWGKLSKLKKIALVAFVILDVFYWAGIGTNVGVVNNFLTIFFMLVVTHPKLASVSKLKTRHKLYIFCSLLLILILFSINISQRDRYNSKGDHDIYQTRVSDAKINKNSFLFNITNTSIHGTIISASSYLNQGYYHMTMAFDEDYDWTYGLGNNYTTLGISSKIAGENLLPKTYVGKLQKKGVDPFINWHSAYLWFANDFTFFGVPFVLFFLGFLFAVSWKATLKLNDPFAPVIFIFSLIEIFYLCANNQVFSFSFYPFHIVMFLWIFNRYLYARRTVPEATGG